MIKSLKSRLNKLEQAVGEPESGGVAIYDEAGRIEHRGRIYRNVQALKKQFPDAGWIFLPKKNERSYD